MMCFFKKNIGNKKAAININTCHPLSCNHKPTGNNPVIYALPGGLGTCTRRACREGARQRCGTPDSTWRLEVEESGTQRLVVVLRTFEDFGTWGGHLNEERRTARIPTRAYVNCEESVPVLFQEDQDPQMVMARPWHPPSTQAMGRQSPIQEMQGVSFAIVMGGFF